MVTNYPEVAKALICQRIATIKAKEIKAEIEKARQASLKKAIKLLDITVKGVIPAVFSLCILTVLTQIL